MAKFNVNRTLNLAMQIYANDIIANSILSLPDKYVPPIIKSLLSLGISLDKIRVYRKFVKGMPPMIKTIVIAGMTVSQALIITRALPGLISGFSGGFLLAPPKEEITP